MSTICSRQSSIKCNTPRPGQIDQRTDGYGCAVRIRQNSPQLGRYGLKAQNFSFMRRGRRKCPHCQSGHTQARPERTELGYQRFRCKSCCREFNERTGTPFNRLQYPSGIVCLVVLWRLRYKLSLRDLAEMFLERGFVFTHEAVRSWEATFAPS
jgi:transposase-like protein